jgi:hypothetical protein
MMSDDWSCGSKFGNCNVIALKAFHRLFRRL